jgi:hypothetical protein
VEEGLGNLARQTRRISRVKTIGTNRQKRKSWKKKFHLGLVLPSLALTYRFGFG